MTNREFENTAVLLFTRQASEEACEKEFCSQFNANRLIAGKMISHAVAVIRKSGLPCFIVDSLHQHGNNFGERFTDAVEQVFHAGFDRVIAIGNDCPTLTASDLQEAAWQLEQSDCVIGPSTDGGFYLIGIDKNAFDSQLFLNSPWKTEQLFSFIVGWLNQQGQTVSVAAMKGDIDSAKDLPTVFYNFGRSAIALLGFIRSVLASVSRNYPSLVTSITLPAAQSAGGLRAPPATQE
jgi:glycosyltransferase A (GT-A) superfamily protein (DUF2064 family)